MTGISQSAVEGIDRPAVDAWLADAVGLEPPCAYTLLAGGHSNLTFRVEDRGGRAVVLRRPPLGHVLQSAHDMGREHRIISALWGTAVPVPQPLAFCADAAVTGAPFYVMAFVEGHVGAAEIPAASRSAVGPSFAGTLGHLHLLVPADVGLGELARQDGYVERQLGRWLRQLSTASPDPPEPLLRGHAALSSVVPAAQRVSIVHGDYRLANMLVAADGRIAAVLDWELCSLGDPLTDIALASASWIGPGEDGSDQFGPSSATAPGFAARTELVRHYGELTGLDLVRLDFYVAFNQWRLACILEGVCARYRAGVMGRGADLPNLERRARRLAAAALETAEKLG